MFFCLQKAPGSHRLFDTLTSGRLRPLVGRFLLQGSAYLAAL